MGRRTYLDVLDNDGNWTGLSGFKEVYIACSPIFCPYIAMKLQNIEILFCMTKALTPAMWAVIHDHVNRENWTIMTHSVQCYNFNALLQVSKTMFLPTNRGIFATFASVVTS